MADYGNVRWSMRHAAGIFWWVYNTKTAPTTHWVREDRIANDYTPSDRDYLEDQKSKME